eukprot:TRINITY_DN30021_c0_g1_i1.p1 TRINITY_DN30021_c0_g1~~TRINITY_DN30021_c0_g1_i1.p1  ORF type:complete len:162 (+),score=22.42 TRINITY_DN30021_c0_g1_i1:56-487(+)
MCIRDSRRTMSQSRLSSNRESTNDPALFNLQSASTLQHSSIYWSIPKAQRFNGSKLMDSFPQVGVNLPSTLGARAPALGYGTRRILPDYALLNAKLNPSPDSYNLPSDFNIDPQHTRGRSFGLGFAAYGKVYCPGQSLSLIHI